MIDITNPDYVAGLKSNMHVTFESPTGKEVIKFLEQTCSWYDSIYTPNQPEMTLIKAGRREVLATIKTILELNIEQIIQITHER
jgi:hypothetical protein